MNRSRSNPMPIQHDHEKHNKRIRQRTPRSTAHQQQHHQQQHGTRVAPAECIASEIVRNLDTPEKKKKKKKKKTLNSYSFIPLENALDSCGPFFVDIGPFQRSLVDANAP